MFPGQIHGERAPVCLCHPAELERAPEATPEMNQIHHCRQRGEERSSTALMHQRWGFRWGQHIQTTPVHENYSDFIITRLALLEEGGGIPAWNSKLILSDSTSNIQAMFNVNIVCNVRLQEHTFSIIDSTVLLKCGAEQHFSVTEWKKT